MNERMEQLKKKTKRNLCIVFLCFPLAFLLLIIDVNKVSVLSNAANFFSDDFHNVKDHEIFNLWYSGHKKSKIAIAGSCMVGVLHCTLQKGLNECSIPD